MTTDIQTDRNEAIIEKALDPTVDPTIVSVASPVENHELYNNVTEPPMNDSVNESVEQAWQSTQSSLTTFFADATTHFVNFFKENKQLLTTFGLILAAFFGIKIVFATLNTIDDIPLVSPLLKLVGLVYVVRFVWRYLIREHDRQELIETLNRTKAEVLGSQNREYHN